MEGELLTVNSAYTLDNAVTAITQAFNDDKYVTLKVYSGRRTLPQNDIAHVWYGQIERELSWHPGHAKRHCKYHIGMPILSRDPDLQKYTHKVSQLMRSMSYEERLEFMDLMAVTSLMSVKQKTEYLEWMQRDFDEQGVKLESNRKK